MINEIDAAAFESTFPVGSTFDINDFDDWGIGYGEIANPGTDDKKSAEWALLLRERNALKIALNKAASSNEMAAEQRFRIDTEVGVGQYRVNSLNDSTLNQKIKLPNKLKNYFTNQQDSLNDLVSKIDIDQLPDALRLEYDSMAEEADDFAEEISIAINRANKIQNRRQQKIRVFLEKKEKEQAALPAPEVEVDQTKDAVSTSIFNMFH